MKLLCFEIEDRKGGNPPEVKKYLFLLDSSLILYNCGKLFKNKFGFYFIFFCLQCKRGEETEAPAFLSSLSAECES